MNVSPTRLRSATLLAAALTSSCMAPAAGTPPAAATSDGSRIVWPDEGPATWGPRSTGTEISANDLRTRLYAFAHDSMLGRRIGEPGNLKGTEYVAREFARLGLEPAGDGGSYFQTLAWGPGGFDAGTSRLVVAGTPMAQRTEWIPTAPTAANGFAGAVDLDAVPTVFAGRYGDTTVVLDPALLRGKVAVFLPAPQAPASPPARMLRCDSVPDKFGAAAAAAVEATPAGRRATPVPAMRDHRAQRAGAVAVLVAGLENSSAAVVRDAFTTRNMMQPAAPAPGAPGGAMVSAAAAARLFGRPLTELAIGATGQPVTGAWRFDWQRSAVPANNVVGILRGSDPARANEYVLVGAHNDHVGTTPTAVDHDSLRAVNVVTRRQGANDPVCRPTVDQQRQIDSLIAHARRVRPPRRDSIMNGADDDGSGTVVLLELAERFAAERPARSILFISHQGEEAGLLGSAWFVNNPTVPLRQIVAAHNMDMVGKGRVEQVKFGGPNSLQILGARRLSREFGDIIDSVNAISREPMALDKSWEVPANPLNRFCRSDQVNYVNKDVPVTYFSLGYSQDYHMLTDEPQYVDYDHAARVGRFLYEVMTAIANRRDRPAIAGPDLTMPVCAR